MRGKGYVKCILGKCGGITPAYAGKSDTLFRALLHFRDHPRLCGEKSEKVVTELHRAGSPPPMRGKVDSMYEVGFQSRITPAYAGKRLWRLVEAGSARDHPRLCGEKLRSL